MKVIFLDIDGVLNAAYTRERSPSGTIGLNPQMVLQLKRIVDVTDAVVVLTSSWKKDWDPKPDKRTHAGEYLDRVLTSYGIKIIDRTALQYNAYRGTGIVHWLDMHPDVDSWIALDDDIFPDYEQAGILPRLVHTKFHDGGLTSELADLAIAMLN